MLEWIKQPWPWYVAGPLIGLTVPTLLILGNKHFGISANLRHACAACLPAGMTFFTYDWKKELWNFFFAGGIFVGATLTTLALSSDQPLLINPRLAAERQQYGITDFNNMVPQQIFSFESLLTLRGLILMVVGGFLVGFGTRYAGGCTSGHSIMGISKLQWPSVVATCCFMIGGFVMANWILSFILRL